MTKNSFEDLIAEVNSRKFSPVYFLCGEEAYFVDVLADKIEEKALTETEKAFNQTILYGKETNARQIIETARRLPMMAERQLVVIKEAQALSLKEEEEEQYIAYFQKPVPSTILVFVWKHGTPDARKKFGKSAKQHAVFFEAKPLYENQVVSWIQHWLGQRKFKVENEAAQLLVEFAGTELSNVANELEKVTINKTPGSTISVDDIEQGVGLSKQFSVFELSNALGYRQQSKVYKIVDHFIANPRNGPLVLVLSTLQGFYLKVMQVHMHKRAADNELAGILRVKPFFVKDYKASARNYTEKQLTNIFHILEEYDLRSKGVKNASMKDSELLPEMILKILHHA